MCEKLEPLEFLEPKWVDAMAAHVGGSHPVAATVRAASAAAWSAGGA